MFSKKIEYGYLLLKQLKDSDEKNLKLSKDILKNTGIPYKMGLSILTELVNSGLLESIKGKNGGFYLKAKRISYFDLFIALESKSGLLKLEIIDDEYEKIIFELGSIILEKMRLISII